MLARICATVAALAGLAIPSLASADSAPEVNVSGAPSDVQADGCLTTIDRLSAYKAGSVGTAIEIGRQGLNEAAADPTVDVTGSTGAGPITAYKVEVELSYRRWTVLESKPGEITANASSWSNSFSVDTFTKYGLGVFRFHVTTESAGKICSVTAYVKATQASPFLTIAGAGASVAALLALYLFGSYFGGFGFLQEVSYSVKKKRRLFKPRIRPGPMLGGLLGGAAALVLLQQAALVYPDTRLTLAAPLSGLIFSILFTSTIRKRETGRERRRDDDDDFENEDRPAPKKSSSKSSSRSTSKKKTGRHPSKEKAGGGERKRPAAQRPRPTTFTPTPMPPPPPQPNSAPTMTPGLVPAPGTSPAPIDTGWTPAPSPSPSSSPSPGSAPSATPPPPPPFLG